MSCVGLNRQSDYRATLSVVMPFRTLRVLLATQSVETCIPTLERAERSSQLSYDALRRMPFWTLRVLLRRRASRPAFPRWSVRNDHRNYRTTLCVVCLSGRSASS
ncbi:hypothetical protein CCL12_02250 [Pseudomonas syringae]|nr:hypothetical protein CCL12_02250 [Pseudomonas syringae]